MFHFSVSRIILFIYIIDSVIGYPSIHGRYTRGIDDYQLVVPHKLTHEGKFLTFALPHYFRHRQEAMRRRRAVEDAIHYGLLLNGKRHHLEVWPNHDFLSPNAAFESRRPTENVQHRYIRKVDSVKLCHFTGKIRNHPDSRVAISTCHGLAGYIVLNGRRYYVEPVSEHGPNKRGHHLHMVYHQQASEHSRYSRSCGTTGNWTEAWKESLRKNYLKYGEFRNETKRGTASAHRYLETLIVVDKKFLDYYKNKDFETYILTILNMVADYYHDASAGNLMDFVVVRVIYLEREEEEIDLTINQDADATLASFCKWQQTINPKDIHSPNHHDIAVLLTRYDICTENMANCGLLGLAYVATACDPTKSCAINEDSGLLLSVVVTHEVGHVMGCNHDESDSDCPSRQPDKSYNVMSPNVYLNTRQWSTCSRAFITTLFDNDLGECLNDEPQKSIYNFPNILPGVVYDGDYQCRMQNPEMKQCKSAPDKGCKQLHCGYENARSCTTFGQPAADGTKCGENKWCYELKCIAKGQRPEAINGGWGEWSEYTPCSRTCGGGISASKRDCTNPVPRHSGRYCIGERMRHKFCNTQPCAAGASSFRNTQCEEFNNKPVQGKISQWKEIVIDDLPCVLFCLNQENTYSKLAPRVKDGTRCKKGTKDTCIGGSCMKVGCDFEVNSQAVEDMCGVCQGDGTTCKVIDRTYDAPAGHQYVKIATIPKGSINLRIEENAPSDNTIAIRAVDGPYLLNGNNVEEKDGSYKFDGDEGIYSHPEPQKEMFVMKGPLKQALEFYVVFYSAPNVGYHYTYADPSSHSDYKPSYHWEIVNYGDCSVRCGSGSQMGEADCLEEKAGKVSPTFCHNIEKPAVMSRVCNEKPCEIKWRTGKWSKCNACHNKSGVRVREVECVRESPVKGADDILVEDNLCPSPKPGTRELCDSKARCVSSKRSEYDLPSDMMEELWYQTVVDYIDADPAVRRDVVSCDPRTRRMIRHNLKRQLRARKACVVPGTAKGEAKAKGDKAKLHVGTIVKDMVPLDKITVIEVPVNHCSLDVNISDSSFEKIGDTVVDSLDYEHQKVRTGKEALEMMKALQFKNSTNATLT